MRNINAVLLTGNLTRDPERKELPGGTTLCEFGLAVNENYKSGDQWEERVNFFDVVVFGGQADTCAQYLAKGRSVAVNGRLRYESWEDKNGNKRSKVRIVGEQVQFLADGRGGGGGGGSAGGSQSASSSSGGYRMSTGRDDEAFKRDDDKAANEASAAARAAREDDDIPF